MEPLLNESTTLSIIKMVASISMNPVFRQILDPIMAWVDPIK